MNTTNPSNSTTAALATVTQIVAVGSVDGICSTAAVLRHAAQGSEVVFTQAFAVDKVDVNPWLPGRSVLFVDLAVNNRDKCMTEAFLRRVVDAGHSIVGVLDEHNAEDWALAFAAAGLDFDALTVKPVSGKGTAVHSSGALLASLLGDEADGHTAELCAAADAGDKMDFTTHFGGMVNAAVKSRIADDSRRVHLAMHLAQQRDPDEQIAKWIAEYEEILGNHDAILAEKVDIGGGMVRVVTADKAVDMTTLLSGLYQAGARVVVVDGLAFSKEAGAKVRQISFGCAPQLKVDLVAALKAGGVNASGFAQKANIAPVDEDMATAIVRATIAEA